MKNKRIAIIVIAALIFSILLFGARNLLVTKELDKQNVISVEYKEPALENAKAIAEWETYKNDTAGYGVKYPLDWQVFDEEANSDLAEVEISDEVTLKQGGSVFWSNKDSIEYTEEDKPEDFLLLGLVTYKKSGTSLGDFAKILGFTAEVESSSVMFKANNIVGGEYVSIGVNEENPRVAIIFKDKDHFYVFHLGFIGSNQEALKIMEEIVGSFRIRDV